MLKRKVILLVTFLLCVTRLYAQNNVRLVPDQDTVCSGTSLSIWIAGNSFQPLYYYWSSPGSVSFTTTSTIPIMQSGYYSLTVTGFMGNSSKMRSYTFQRYYTVPSSPSITVIKGPWVCRFDNVELEAEPGYTNYVWSDGQSGTTFNRIMDSTYTSPQLDTVHVWYTANAYGCLVTSDTLILRGVRAPNGVGQFYCGRMNINPNDSIPAGLVLDYIYPTQYEMEFTQVSNPTNIFTYFPPLGSRKAPASLLIPGEVYSVRTRVIINGQVFCWGTSCNVKVQLPIINSNNRVVEVLPNYFITVTPEGKYIISDY